LDALEDGAKGGIVGSDLPTIHNACRIRRVAQFACGVLMALACKQQMHSLVCVCARMRETETGIEQERAREGAIEREKKREWARERDRE